jgi:hypothetical protein
MVIVYRLDSLQIDAIHCEFNEWDELNEFLFVHNHLAKNSSPALTLLYPLD